jgi:hypothetical protein
VKKYLSAILYAIQIPVSVWAGIELDHKAWMLGGSLIAAMMIVECAAVLLFLDGQADDIERRIKN